MYQIDELINTDKTIFPDLPCDTLILTWYNEKTNKDELYLGCEFNASVCNIHLYIPEEYRTKEKIEYAKEEFFPAVMRYLKEQFVVNTVIANCEESDTKIIQLMEEVGFNFKRMILGYIKLKEDSWVLH